MNKKASTNLVISVLLVISILASLAIIMLISSKLNNTDVSGFSVKTESENSLLENDIIEINKDDLLKCCSFINTIGEEDGCYVLKGYDCSYCSAYC